jgi:hypothetical protein
MYKRSSRRTERRSAPRKQTCLGMGYDSDEDNSATAHDGPCSASVQHKAQALAARLSSPSPIEFSVPRCSPHKEAALASAPKTSRNGRSQIGASAELSSAPLPLNSTHACKVKTELQLIVHLAYIASYFKPMCEVTEHTVLPWPQQGRSCLPHVRGVALRDAPAVITLPER